MATKRNVKSLELLEPILVKTFGLNTLYKPTFVLTEWLEVDISTGLNEHEMYLLNQVIEKLIKNMSHWNEEELKMNFISMIMLLAHFDDPIKTYYDREISEYVGDVYLKCKADMMLSKGIGELIEMPYFFMHEYKREKKYSGDPIGQMLGAMLIGQAKNNNDKPVYGCYVQGRFWFFTVLEGKDYVVSNAYNSSEMHDAKQIIFILRKLKQIIIERLMIY
jgi:hypothetical protein